MFKVLMKRFWSFVIACVASFGAFQVEACDDLQERLKPVSVSYSASQNGAAQVVPAALYGPAPCPSKARDWAVLVDPWQLIGEHQFTQMQVLDIRSTQQLGGGMLPNATRIAFDAWRDQGHPGMPASDAELSAIIGHAGLRLDQAIVVVAQSNSAQDLARAAYVYWVLTSLGAERVAILNGGFAAWTGAALPTTTKPAKRAPYTADLTFSKTYMASDYEVYGIAMMQLEGRLLDVRAGHVVNRFDSRGQAVATTLPGALSAPVETLLASMQEAGSTTRVKARIAAQIADYGVEGGMVSFSSTGEFAALTWFFASQVAGLENVRVYADGIQGWKDRGGKMFRSANAYDMRALHSE